MLQSLHTYGLTSLLLRGNQLRNSVFVAVVYSLNVHVNGKVERAVELLFALLTLMVPVVLSVSVAEVTETSWAHLIPK